MFKKIRNFKFKLKYKAVVIFFTIIISLGFAFWLGLYVGMDVQPRSFISLNKCEENCLKSNEITGLVGAIGVELQGQKLLAVKENDNCFSLKIPTNKLKTHYTIVPKQDIKDLGDLSSSENQIILDCFAIISEHIKEDNLQEYQITSNGPDYQHVRYLHFHIKSIKK